MTHMDTPLLQADFPTVQAAFTWLDDIWWADAHPEILHASGRYPSLDDKSMPSYLYVGFLLHTDTNDPATAHGGICPVRASDKGYSWMWPARLAAIRLTNDQLSEDAGLHWRPAAFKRALWKNSWLWS